MKLFYLLSLFIFIEISTTVQGTEILFPLEEQNVNSSKFHYGDVFKLNLSKIVDSVNDEIPIINADINEPLKISSHNLDTIAKLKDDYLDITTYKEQISDIQDDVDLEENSDSYIIQLKSNEYKYQNSNLCPPCKCGVKTTKRIVGGESTASNKYPWIVLLSYKRKFFCGGSLINDRFVVTAGHCTNGIQSEYIHVYLNEFKRSLGNISETIIREVKNVYRPLKYNHTTYNNDISLLKLNRPVDINTGLIRPICLPHDKSSFAGQNAIATGWGLKYKRKIPITNLLRTQYIKMLSNSQCQLIFLSRTITSSMLCGEYPGGNQNTTKGTCGGDTGGPVMIIQDRRQRLAGIVSWGLGCSTKMTAGVYTRISKFNGWIKKLSEGACWCD